ncbi:MAG: DUF2079 domain-containing protein [Minicystis sp.]
MRTRLSQLAASVDALAARAGDLAVAHVLWPILYAVALGSSLFVAAHPGLRAALAQNKVLATDARAMLVWIGVAFAGIALIHIGVVFAARRASATPPASVEVVHRVNRILRPTLVLPIVESLALPAIERDHPRQTLFLITLAAAVTGVLAYSWIRPVEARSPADDRSPGRDRLALLAASVLWAAYTLFFARLSITNHHALNTRTLSLGIYDNIFYQSIHGHPLGCSFVKTGYHGSAHFDPILVLFSPLYLLYPRAELILVLQSLWLGAGVVPVVLIARAHGLGRGVALAIGAMFVAYPALHGANLYEFHSLTLATPVTLWLLWFLERGATRGYWIALAAALLVREDMPILTTFIGVYAVLARRPRLLRAGWITILVSLAYFAAVKRWFMTSPDIFMTGNDAYSFAYNYDALIPQHDGARGIVTSILTNPVFVIQWMLSEPKVLFLLSLFVPLAFLPFFARPGRVMLAWGLLFSLLASRPALHAIHFHYPSIITPVAFALVPAALRRIEDSARLGASGLDGRRVARALLAAALVASALASWKLGGFVANESFRAGYLPVARSLNDEERATYAWLRAAVDRIPPDARVAVTNRMGPHASNRAAVFMIPTAAEVDWLLVDDAELHDADRARVDHDLQSGAFALVTRRGALALYQRR